MAEAAEGAARPHAGALHQDGGRARFGQRPQEKVAETAAARRGVFSLAEVRVNVASACVTGRPQGLECRNGGMSSARFGVASRKAFQNQIEASAGAADRRPTLAAGRCVGRPRPAAEGVPVNDEGAQESGGGARGRAVLWRDGADGLAGGARASRRRARTPNKPLAVFTPRLLRKPRSGGLSGNGVRIARKCRGRPRMTPPTPSKWVSGSHGPD